MKKINELGDENMDVWRCYCGTFMPVKRGNPKPVCGYCIRVTEVDS